MNGSFQHYAMWKGKISKGHSWNDSTYMSESRDRRLIVREEEAQETTKRNRVCFWGDSMLELILMHEVTTTQLSSHSMFGLLSFSHPLDGFNLHFPYPWWYSASTCQPDTFLDGIFLVSGYVWSFLFGWLVGFVWLFETMFHWIALANLQLTNQIRLALNLWNYSFPWLQCWHVIMCYYDGSPAGF